MKPLHILDINPLSDTVPLQAHSSLVAHTVTNPPAMQETWV